MSKRDWFMGVPLLGRAANIDIRELDRLREENKRLRAALEEIGDHTHHLGWSYAHIVSWIRRRAKAAVGRAVEQQSKSLSPKENDDGNG